MNRSQHGSHEPAEFWLSQEVHNVAFMCSRGSLGHCLLSVTPGGEIWKANMEGTGEGCGGFGASRKQQPWSGPEDSKRSPWCVTLANPPCQHELHTLLWNLKTWIIDKLDVCYGIRNVELQLIVPPLSAFVYLHGVSHICTHTHTHICTVVYVKLTLWSCRLIVTTEVCYKSGSSTTHHYWPVAV